MPRLSPILVMLLLAGPVAGAQAEFDFARADLAEAARSVPLRGALRLAGVPLDRGGVPVTLVLERVAAFAPDALVEVHGPAGRWRLPVPDHAYFRGGIEGHPGSRAVLTAQQSGEVHGWLFDGPRLLALGPDRAQAGRLVTRELDGAAARTARRCAGAGLEPPALAAPPARRPATEPVRAAYTARVAVETDWGFMQNLSPNPDPSVALNYVGDLFAYASSLFDREVDTSLLVSYVSLWTTVNDPWDYNGIGARCALMEFGRYWNLNQPGVERSTAHFLSGRILNGGAAWEGVLCGPAFPAGETCPSLPPEGSAPGGADLWGGSYGLTDLILGGFSLESPNQVWDFIGLAHGLGHNFGSPHTNCYGGLGGDPSPVDACDNGETGAGCWSRAVSLPGPGALTGGTPSGSNGTLMSSCQALDGGLANVALTLGLGHPDGVAPGRVPARMHDHVLARAQAYPGCLTFTPSTKGDFNLDRRADLILHHPLDNQHAFWMMNGATLWYQAGLSPTTPLARRVAGAADFNADQRSDVVMQNPYLGSVEFWMMKSTGLRWGLPVALSGSTTLPPEWLVAATADFNRDGWPDLLWRHSISQKLAIWTLNGTAQIGTITPSPDQAVHANWAVVAALDYDGNATTDLLWYNATSGRIVLWFMDPAVQRTTGQFTSPAQAGDANWKVVASADYGVGPGGWPGTNDVVWRNDNSGKLAIWYLDLAGARTSGEFTSPDSPADPLNWTVVGPR